MLTLRYPMYAPPGGRWFYEVPETGRSFDADSKREVVRTVTQHYVVNKLPVPSDLDARIEDYLCRHIAYGACQGDDPRDPADRPISYFEVVSATEALFRGRAHTHVSPREAEARAGRCRVCKMHSVGMCTSCNQLQATARAFVGGRSLPCDNMLGVCRVFRVPVNGLVYVRDATAAKLPPNCWALK